MKTANAKELNEKYKDCPTREKEIIIDGRVYIVVSHFVGRKTSITRFIRTLTIRLWTRFLTPEKTDRTKEKYLPNGWTSSVIYAIIVYIESSCFGRKEYICYQSRQITM